MNVSVSAVKRGRIFFIHLYFFRGKGKRGWGVVLLVCLFCWVFFFI